MKEKLNTLKKNRLLIAIPIVLLLAGGGYIALGGGEAKLAAAATTGNGSGGAQSTGTSGGGGLAAYDTDGDGTVYQDGMHPWIVQDAPGPSPDHCGMNLTPVRVDGAQEAGTVRIDPVTIQNIGVRTAPVTIEALGRTVRTTGRFEANGRGLSAVAPKVGGWVEKLYVEYEGARVRRGQPLLEIYSPDLVSTQEEYLLAFHNAERVGSAMGTSDAQRLVEAARRRLAYWDISEAQIERLEETGRPQKTLTLYAPASGTVTTKNVVEGQQIAPGQTLLELADLSRLWLMVDVYEQDLAWVRVGTPVRVELPYEPGRTLTGRVDYLYDDLDPQTRTVKARVTIPNPGLRLKPGMYATVYLTGGEAQPVPTVPSEAVIRTGEREVVILALGEGRFRPQEVVTGVGADGKVQVFQGLSGGEQVVTSAQFLIDSEARLRSALSAMVSSHSGASGGPGAPTMPGMEMDDAAPVHQHGTSAQDSAKTVRVAVDASGFEPQRIEIKAGVPVRLVFTRTTDATCATSVTIPDFGVENRKLPLNEPVTVELRPSASGTYSFACGMGMLKGTIVVNS